MFSRVKHLFSLSGFPLSPDTVPDMLREARSNSSPQSSAGTNPSDKGVWERETFSC